MASTLPEVSACCTPCEEPLSVEIPGAQGAAGAAGTNGTDGIDAFTTTTAQFLMPAEGADVTASVVNSDWMTPTQKVYVQNAGYMEVRSKPSSVQVVLRNIEDTAAGEYAENVPPTTPVASSSSISPAGPQGPAGTTPAGVLLAANNLSDLASTPTARTNLGLGTAAVLNTGVADGNIVLVDDAGGLTTAEALFATATGIESQAAATARTSLGAQAQDALLDALAALVTVADRLPYFTGPDAVSLATFTAFGRSLVDDADAAAARETLGKVMARYGLLGSLSGVDLNSATSDNPITLNSTRYRIDKVTVENASISLTTATAGLFTAAGGGGTTVAADQALSALTASTKFDDLTLQAVTTTDVFTDGTVYFRVGTPQGAAATADVWLFGWRFDA